MICKLPPKLAPLIFILLTAVTASSIPSIDGDQILKKRYAHYLEKTKVLFTKNNEDWLSSHPPSVEELNSPVFYGAEPNSLFYETFPLGTWAAGVATTSRHLFLFVKDSAEKMCSRSKRKLKSYGFIPAYELMLESLDPNSEASALYATKEGRFLHLSAVGSWWAGLYREGMWVERTNQKYESPVEKEALAEIWEADESSILVFSNRKFGVENQDIIKVALESVESDHVPLGQVVSNLAPLFLTSKYEKHGAHGRLVFYTSESYSTKFKNEKDVLVVVRVGLSQST